MPVLARTRPRGAARRAGGARSVPLTPGDGERVAERASRIAGSCQHRHEQRGELARRDAVVAREARAVGDRGRRRAGRPRRERGRADRRRAPAAVVPLPSTSRPIASARISAVKLSLSVSIERRGSRASCCESIVASRTRARRARGPSARRAPSTPAGAEQPVEQRRGGERRARDGPAACASRGRRRAPRAAATRGRRTTGSQPGDRPARVEPRRRRRRRPVTRRIPQRRRSGRRARPRSRGRERRVAVALEDQPPVPDVPHPAALAEHLGAEAVARAELAERRVGDAELLVRGGLRAAVSALRAKTVSPVVRSTAIAADAPARRPAPRARGEVPVEARVVAPRRRARERAAAARPIASGRRPCGVGHAANLARARVDSCRVWACLRTKMGRSAHDAPACVRKYSSP